MNKYRVTYNTPLNQNIHVELWSENWRQAATEADHMEVVPIEITSVEMYSDGAWHDLTNAAQTIREGK